MNMLSNLSLYVVLWLSFLYNASTVKAVKNNDIVDNQDRDDEPEDAFRDDSQMLRLKPKKIYFNVNSSTCNLTIFCRQPKLGELELDAGNNVNYINESLVVSMSNLVVCNLLLYDLFY
jgi:hypothetical protein